MRGEPVYSCPKPGKGTQQIERVTKSLGREKQERSAKDEAKARDKGKCRWPHPPSERALCQRLRKEAAHWQGKSTGGQNEVENLILLCASVHQGVRSLHSTHRRVVPLTDKRMSGPCAYEQREQAEDASPWLEIGREVSIGVFLRKKAKP